MKKVLVLGAGMVGGEIASDLSSHFYVSIFDRNVDALKKVSERVSVQTIVGDLSNHEEVFKVAQQHDIIVGAMPGFLAFEVLSRIISAGKPIVDISFFNENPLELDGLAQKYNIPVIVDFGVAPGMSNFLLGLETTKMKVEKFVCFVGGLPVRKEPPWNYKAPFEVKSIIDEYLRPARIKVDGKIVIKPALSDPEEVIFEKIGALEAFNTDGLRTVLDLDVPTMAEKTLRYPGYREHMELLIKSGFFSEESLSINGSVITPKEITTEILSKAWKLSSGEKEFTAMRLIMEGTKDGATRRVEYNLFDQGDDTTGASSMSRVTGYSCSAVVNLVANNMIPQVGIITPEKLGMKDGMADFVLNYLKDRGINYDLS